MRNSFAFRVCHQARKGPSERLTVLFCYGSRPPGRHRGQLAARTQLQIPALARIQIRSSCLPGHRSRRQAARTQLRILTLARIQIWQQLPSWALQPAARQRGPSCRSSPWPGSRSAAAAFLGAALASWQRGPSCRSSPWPGSRSAAAAFLATAAGHQDATVAAMAARIPSCRSSPENGRQNRATKAGKELGNIKSHQSAKTQQRPQKRPRRHSSFSQRKTTLIRKRRCKNDGTLFGTRNTYYANQKLHRVVQQCQKDGTYFMHHVYILACPPGKNTKKNVFHNAATRPQNAPFLRGLCPVRTHKTRSAAAAFLGATVASWQRGSPAADPHPGPDPDLAAAAFLGAAAGHQDATVAGSRLNQV